MLRRRMMLAQGGVSLPAGYTKIEYLESDGSQFIDTGVSAKGGFRAQLTVSQLSATPEAYIIGAHGTGIPYARNGIGISSDKYMIGMCGYELLAPAQYDTQLEIDFSTIIPNAYLKVNGETLGTFSSYINADATNGTELTSNNILIFSSQWHAVTIQPPLSIKAKLWKCKIYSADGILVRDYIPCSNPIGVKGLWDKVNEEFYALTPTGYTRLAYLESNGSDYIDTGFKPNQDTRVVMDAYVLDGSNVDWITLFGARSESYARCFGAFVPGSLTTTAQQYMFNYGGAEAYYVDTNSFQRRLVDFNKNVISIDGVVAVTAPAATFQTSVSLYLFATNDDDIASFLHKVRVYSCKIYDNGTLIRDFIPCTNPDGISGLWDSVNNVFYKMLPADYTRLDFIETDGTTYIDTGFKPNQDTRVVMDVELNSQSSYPKVLFGARNGSTTSDASFIVWAITANGFRTDFGSESLVTTVVPTGRFVIDKNKNVTTFNGIEYTNPAYTFQCDYNIGLFTQIDVDGPDNRVSTAKLYSCKIYDNGTLVRDFIPAMNASGEAGLYDLKNDVWYALKLVVTKVENKISVTVYQRKHTVTLPDGDTTTIYSYYACAKSSTTAASEIKVGIAWYSDMFGNSTVTLTLSVYGISTEALLGSSYSDLRITSISPTEDDTYIYTF